MFIAALWKTFKALFGKMEPLNSRCIYVYKNMMLPANGIMLRLFEAGTRYRYTFAYSKVSGRKGGPGREMLYLSYPSIVLYTICACFLFTTLPGSWDR